MVHYKPHQNLVDLLGPRRPKSRCYLAGTCLEAWMKNPIPSSFRLLADSVSGLEERTSGATHPSIFKPARVHWVLLLLPISLSSFPATSLESWIFSYRQWGNRILPLSLRPFQYAQWTSNCQYLYLYAWGLFWNFEGSSACAWKLRSTVDLTCISHCLSSPQTRTNSTI